MGGTAFHKFLEAQPAPDDEDEEWDREYKRQLFFWAAEKIRGEFQHATWQAFWQTAVESRPGKQVAENLGMSLGAVYIAKSRAVSRLRLRLRIEEVAEG